MVKALLFENFGIRMRQCKIKKKNLDYDHTIGQKVLLIKDGVLCKAEDKNTSPWTITQVHCNGTVRIQCGSMSE